MDMTAGIPIYHTESDVTEDPDQTPAQKLDHGDLARRYLPRITPTIPPQTNQPNQNEIAGIRLSIVRMC